MPAQNGPGLISKNRYGENQTRVTCKEAFGMKHSVYFEGKVQSLSLQVEGTPATVGVMKPGNYTFSTSSEEHMTVISGLLRAVLPGSCRARDYSPGETFVVPPGSSFDVEAVGDVAYLCLYK